MSELERERLTAVPTATPSTATPTEDAAPQDRVYRHRSSWPATRLAANVMTLVLGLAISAPSIIPELRAPLWPALLLPALIATLSGRLVFESIEGSMAVAAAGAHLLAAAAGALVATTVMAAATRVAGLHTVVVEPLTLTLSVLVLLGAALVRDLEIRLRLALRRVYFVGSGDGLTELRRELARSGDASLVGATNANAPLSSEAITHAVGEARATVLVLDQSAARARAVVAAAASLSSAGVHVRDLLAYYEAEFKKVPLTELTPAWFRFERDDHGRGALANAGRRVFAVCFAGVLLIITLPVIAVLMVAVRLTSPGPAIFRQTRVGLHDSRFTLVKLRTMTVPHGGSVGDASAAWATDEDHRITPLGRVLRRYRLDELPQLWNVIRGDLALIGPRPEQVPIVERLEQAIPYYAARHTIRPGLTGWAQVNLGYSGSLEGARAKLQRDLYYVKHRGLRLDFLILWLTLKAVFTDPR